ncbi:DUF6301 family protein [Nocardia vinacea]|uniref:DUF6301 family protein n=1 Tax=Nocardia vinacea TaxID=96468 RepID=UPI0033FA6D5D
MPSTSVFESPSAGPWPKPTSPRSARTHRGGWRSLAFSSDDRPASHCHGRTRRDPVDLRRYSARLSTPVGTQPADLEGAARIARIGAGFDWTWTRADVPRFCEVAGWEVIGPNSPGVDMVSNLNVKRREAYANTSTE